MADRPATRARALVAAAVARCPDDSAVAVQEGPVGDVPHELGDVEVARMRSAVGRRRREFHTG